MHLNLYSTFPSACTPADRPHTAPLRRAQGSSYQSLARRQPVKQTTLRQERMEVSAAARDRSRPPTIISLIKI